MNTKNKKLLSLFIITIIAALVSTAARALMTVLYLDADYGVYA